MLGVRQSAVILTGFNLTKHVIAILLLVLPGGVGVSGCGDAARSPQVLQARCEPSDDEMKPGEFTSPSKAFRLERVPHNEKYDIGGVSLPRLTGARYRMTCRGKEIWAVERDYALQHPLVTDDGTVVGVAYRNEYEDGDPGRYSGDFLHIVILRNGQDVVDWMAERVSPRYESCPVPPRREPYGEILTVDPANDRIIVVVHENDDTLFGRTAGWLFRLSTGELLPRIDFERLFLALGRVDPAEVEKKIGFSAGVLELEVVGGTPLILLHCRSTKQRYAGEGPWTIEDSLFIVSDGDGAPIWSLLVPRNTAYALKEESFLHSRQIRDPTHPLLITGKPGSFGVFRTWEDCVETYRVENRGAQGWSLTKTGRTMLEKARLGGDRMSRAESKVRSAE